MSKLSQPCSTSMILHGDYINAISKNSVVLGERIDAEFFHINESILMIISSYPRCNLSICSAVVEWNSYLKTTFRATVEHKRRPVILNHANPQVASFRWRQHLHNCGVNGSISRHRQRFRPQKKSFVLTQPPKALIFLACFESICINKAIAGRSWYMRNATLLIRIVYSMCGFVLVLLSWAGQRWSVTSLTLHLWIPNCWRCNLNSVIAV